jgi:hypothetical protein
MITIRQLTHFAPNHFGDYYKWYKNTIGEMNYNNVTKNEFEAVLAILTKLVIYENDPKIVQVHLDIAIPPPINCNSLVMEFKQFTRSRLMILRNGQENYERIVDMEIKDPQDANKTNQDKIVDLTMSDSDVEK